jgi:spore photoproduct lyase
MDAASLLNINTLYYDAKALNFPRGKEIFNKYKDVENKILVDSHWRIEELNNNPDMVREWNKTKAQTLVLGVKTAIASRPNSRSTDWIAPSHSSGCAMACSYCYVARRKGYANPIAVFANICKVIAHIRRKCEKLGAKILTPENTQCDPVYWTWDIGENNDCSVDDLVSDNVKDLIKSFVSTPNGKASFATKFVNRQLLGYDPQLKTRVRFSLMPESVSKVVDVRTSSIAERISAINDFVDAGYEVHINLSPVILYEGWQRDYADLFTQLDDVLSSKAKEQLKAEVIFLTHNEKLHELNMQWHPQAEEKYLWRHWDDENDKSKNKFGLPVIQQRKLSQNGMVNLRYKNNFKAEAVDNLKSILSLFLPYCQIRYIF